ncbi:hypothetical protein LUZ60_015999 [Juncus effusus]|nr:hypothetical protein LUZ60_015999 [Juncus effusus]
MTTCFFWSLRSKVHRLLRALQAGTDNYWVNCMCDEKVEHDLSELDRLVRRIQATLNDVQQRDMCDQAIKLWVRELENLAQDAALILEECHSQLSSKAIEHDDVRIFAYVERIYGTPIGNYSFFGRHSKLSTPEDMIHEIKEIRIKFDEISRDREALRLTEDDGERRVRNRPLPTGHLMDKSSTFGRITDKNEIVDLVLDGINEEAGEETVKVIALLGMGGLGKTTVAQMVYDDPIIQDMFDVMAWVYVSSDFDVIRLTKEIAEFVTGLRGGGFDGFSKVQEAVAKGLVGKTLFLVLDDAWNEQRNDWELLLLPLKAAKLVRVLVTTRNETITHVVQPISRYHLGFLPEDECWQLFQHYAFGTHKMKETSRFSEIGRQLIRKCCGLPLAVKCIGGLLSFERNEESWRDILYSELWESGDNVDQVFRALRVSYDHLPFRLRRCFLFCSLFPKGSVIKKTEIIYMWKAHGYIESNKYKKRPEDVGEQYLDELQMRSFIISKNNRFILHDVMYDLAKSLSRGEIHTVIDDKSCQLSDEVCHLYVKRGNINLIRQSEAKPAFKLRTFLNALVNHETFVPKFLLVLGLIGTNVHALKFSHYGELRYLRYLGIREFYLEELSESIGYLHNLEALIISSCHQLRKLPLSIIHLNMLRYLHISRAGIEELPETLSELSNLQTLHIEECNNIKELPKGFGERLNIYALCLKSCKNITELPNSIGDLFNLHYLDLSSSAIRTLPESISHLYNLVKMDLQGCSELIGLPLSIKNLLHFGQGQLVIMPQDVRIVDGTLLQDYIVQDFENFTMSNADADNSSSEQTRNPSLQLDGKELDIARARIVPVKSSYPIQSIKIHPNIGYDELKKDIAGMFHIKVPIATEHTKGWKIEYKQCGTEKILPFGSEPWEDFHKSVDYLVVLDFEAEMIESGSNLTNSSGSGNSIAINNGKDGRNTWMSPYSKSFYTGDHISSNYSHSYTGDRVKFMR